LLHLKKDVQDLTTVLTLIGTLDISTTHVISSALEELSDIAELVFDFSELEFIDSTGIGSILEAIHLSNEKNFTVKLQGVDELTDHVFETVGLYQLLNVLQGRELNVSE
jgi:anti-anti-sigma factor